MVKAPLWGIPKRCSRGLPCMMAAVAQRTLNTVVSSFPAYKRDLLSTGHFVWSLLPGDYMVYTTNICPPVWRKYLRSRPGWDCMQIECITMEKSIGNQIRITNNESTAKLECSSIILITCPPLPEKKPPILSSNCNETFTLPTQSNDSPGPQARMYAPRRQAPPLRPNLVSS